MKLTEMRVEDIIPYENNPRHNDNAVEAVAESIRQCSYLQPIIVDENHIILAGHTRLKALISLGYKNVPVVIYEGLTESQKKKFRYLDNKTAEAAYWDLPKLTEELEKFDLGDMDFFNMANESFEVRIKDEGEGVTEYEPEVFGDESFNYECPLCGFRF